VKLVVSAIENRTNVFCRTIGPAEPGPSEGWLRVPVVIEETYPVEGWPDLLADTAGREILALIPGDLAVDVTAFDSRWQGVAELVQPGLIRVRKD